jgi:hypothetical protein
MPNVENSKKQTDMLAELHEIHEEIVLVEDEFAKICAIPAWVKITRATSLGFDGECLQLKRFDREGAELDCVDVLTLGFEDSSLLCKVVRMLPVMHERLVADASVSIEDMLRATEEARAFLATVKSNH